MLGDIANTFSILATNAWSGVVDFLYDYQTLLTGIMAVSAAYYAGKPVWQQLEATNLQTKILVRDTLAQRLREAHDRYGRMRKDIRQPLNDLGNLTHLPGGEVIPISAEDAFGFEGLLHGKLDWYLVTLRDTEVAEIESAKVKLKTALDSLVETLGDAHWADHNDQFDDDPDFGSQISDGEWATIQQKCMKAKTLTAAKLKAAFSALASLEDAQKRWIDALRLQISALDLGIARAL